MQGQFWSLIATGITTAEVALSLSVSVPVGIRWFRQAGCKTPLSPVDPGGRYLSFEECEETALLRAQKLGVREIARRFGRDQGTISRELPCNTAASGGKPEYRALVAQWKAQQAVKRRKAAHLVVNDRLRDYVQEWLSGHVHPPDGSIVVSPRPPAWKGLNKLHRQDRRWALSWSPEQISQRLKIDFAD